MKRAAQAVIAVVLTVGCSAMGKPSASEREAATAALQKEAEALKRDGEKLDPILGVKATWNIQGVDVTEQAGNKNQPFLGTIRFRINSQTREPTGIVETNFERSFAYVYDTGLKQWLLKPKT
jgi:hypothetical protein